IGHDECNCPRGHHASGKKQDRGKQAQANQSASLDLSCREHSQTPFESGGNWGRGRKNNASEFWAQRKKVMVQGDQTCLVGLATGLRREAPSCSSPDRQVG